MEDVVVEMCSVVPDGADFTMPQSFLPYTIPSSMDTRLLKMF